MSGWATPRWAMHHFDLNHARAACRSCTAWPISNVKLLGMSVFRYHHESTEQWEGNCLQSHRQPHAREQARAVGQGPTARGRLRSQQPRWRDPPAGLRDDLRLLEPCDLLSQTQLLNPQNGKLVPASVIDKGKESCRGAGQVGARRTSTRSPPKARPSSCGTPRAAPSGWPWRRRSVGSGCATAWSESAPGPWRRTS